MATINVLLVSSSAMAMEDLQERISLGTEVKYMGEERVDGPAEGCCDYIIRSYPCRAVPRAGLGEEPGWQRYRENVNCLKSPVEQTGSAAWLDLGCGHGAAFESLDHYPGRGVPAKLRFVLVDTDPSGLRASEEKIRSVLGTETEIVAIECDYHRIEELEDSLRRTEWFPFDHVSLVNCIHETDPFAVPALVSLLIRSARPSTGTIYIRDHDPLFEPELGALPWTYEFFRDFVGELCRRHAGVLREPIVAPSDKVYRRKGRLCASFSVLLRRDDSVLEREPEVENALSSWIRAQLPRVQREAECALLRAWESHLSTGRPPEDPEHQKICTYMLRRMFGHLHQMHRPNGGATC